MGVPLASAAKRDSTPVVELQLICLSAETYTYVTVVATGGAEKPQAANWVAAEIAVEVVATKFEGDPVDILVPPVVGSVTGRALVSRGPLIAPT